MSLTKNLLGLSNCDFVKEIKSLLSTKPVEQWCVNSRTNGEGQHCAFGWLDIIDPEDQVREYSQSQISNKAAEILGNRGWPLAYANNGSTYAHIDNPKDRSLAYLEDWLKDNC